MQPHAEERALLKAIATGDAKALERLFARAETRVFRFLMRMVKNQAIAEELLNEVFLSVWQNAHRYEGRSEPMTWMLSIAHTKAMSVLRKRTEVLGMAFHGQQYTVPVWRYHAWWRSTDMTSIRRTRWMRRGGSRSRTRGTSSPTTVIERCSIQRP